MELRFTVITPEYSLPPFEVSSVEFATPDGRLQILRGHSPLIAQLTDEKVTVRSADGTVKIYSVTRGLVSVRDNKCEIYAAAFSER